MISMLKFLFLFHFSTMWRFLFRCLVMSLSCFLSLFFFFFCHLPKGTSKLMWKRFTFLIQWLESLRRKSPEYQTICSLVFAWVSKWLSTFCFTKFERQRTIILNHWRIFLCHMVWCLSNIKDPTSPNTFL